MEKVVTRVQTTPDGELLQYFIWDGDGSLQLCMDATWQTMADVARRASLVFGKAVYEIGRDDARAKIEIFTWS